MAWVIAGCLSWNPLDVFDISTPTVHAINALLKQQCVVFTIVMTRHIPDPQEPVEPLLAWFNAAAYEHQDNITEVIKGLASVDWGLPTSRRAAAHRLIRMSTHASRYS